MSRRKLTITSITTLFACGVILGVFGLSGWFGRSGAGFSSALLPEWKYRRPITLSGQTSNLTDYQVKVELPASVTSALVTAGKLQSVASNFADIRFTDANDNQLLNFWIETATTTATSTIWVKVPGLSASKSSTIYIYYGNPSASSASNGTNTFEFFDDFEDGTVGQQPAGWTVYESGGTIRVSNTQAKTGSKSLKIDDTGSQSPSLYASHSFPAITQGIAYRLWTYYIEGTQYFHTHVGEDIDSYFYGDAGVFKDTSNTILYYYSNGATPSFSQTITTGWYQVEVKATASGDTYYDILINGISKLLGGEALWESVTQFDNFYVAGQPGGATWNGYIDQVLVRKYASPEPTATVGSEQTQMTPVAHWRFDEGSGNIAYNATKKVAETNKWTKRRALSISNSGSTAQTNYQTKIELTPNNFDYSQVKTDGSDIRFVDSDGTELNFWKETWNTSATSTFWVKVPSLPGNTTSTIYIYYGNPSASSASNGTNTFEFFDDFDSYTNGSLNGQGGWSGNVDYEIQSTYAYSGKAVLSDSNIADYIGHSFTAMDKGILTVYMRAQIDGEHLMTWLLDSALNKIYVFMDIHTQAFQYLNSAGSEVGFSPAVPYAAQTWYKVEIAFDTVADKYISIKINDSEKLSNTASPAIGNIEIVRMFRGGTPGPVCVWDNFRVRKYASPEPTVTAVGSQEFGEGSKWSPDAAWISGATWTTGKFNTGLKFDGIDDYVNFGDVDF